ncbi:myo-inosose-2 dehydratase [Pectinatus frisingensis]|jgi:inosose dehydratase|uniref:myo-inosose-2 dehydratase n=1 Tax=Pectinatus frisingensis TaxID=865 RepID=UPI0018C4A764|nr:myo-inosose-2 dehydratase [Pectinatus frisingensis]
MGKIQLGICPIGWTNDDMPDLGKENTFEQCISEMALAGFTGCEIGGKFPHDAVVLKKALALRNLSIASAWFSSYLTTRPYTETAEAFIKHRDFLHEMGAKVIVVSEQGNSIQGQINTPLFANKPHYTEEQWKFVPEGLNKLGKLAKEKDMILVYHHHMGTGVQTETEIDRLMELTDPDLVYLLYDSGHLVCSGEDHLRVLDKYIGRIKHVHLKDVRKGIVEKVKNENLSFLKGVRMGMFTVPGDGDIDFRPIFDILNKNNYSGWALVEAEQDPAVANPLEYALKAHEYVEKIANI